jgi:hypothetical protein
LRALPAPVLDLENLEELGVGCNQLTGLPDGFGSSLPRLTELFLVSNEISYLPLSIGQLEGLAKLELSANALHELPRSFSKLRALRSLWIADNQLTTFPHQLCALDALEILDLQSNRLTSVPKAVGTMPSLTTLLLGGNPLVFPPASVVGKGGEASLEFIRMHRQSDLISEASDRSNKQVAVYRDRLTASIEKHEEQLQLEEKLPTVKAKRAAAAAAAAKAAAAAAAATPAGSYAPARPTLSAEEPEARPAVDREMASPEQSRASHASRPTPTRPPRRASNGFFD